MEKKSDKLINLLNGSRPIYIQTHDFPDPDAIASAFGMQYLLSNKGIESSIIYDGELQTNPVEHMIEDLEIPLINIDKVSLNKKDKIIIVDGCLGNKNVTTENGDIIAVIDHHLVDEPENLSFVDIRTDYGSCSTIVSEYMREQKIKPTAQIATALAIGIHVDTNSFLRRASLQDLENYSFLFNQIDQGILAGILKKRISQNELKVFRHAVQSARIDKKFVFYHYPHECSQNLLGMIADFFMSIEEIEFVALCANNDNKIIFSTRSDSPAWNTDRIIKSVLKGIGNGGGHKDMAGGLIKDTSVFDEEILYQRFKEQLGL